MIASVVKIYTQAVNYKGVRTLILSGEDEGTESGVCVVQR